MAKNRILCAILTLAFITPLVEFKEIELDSEPRKIDSGENLDLRNYQVVQVEELIKLEFQKRKQIELEEQKKREEIEKQKILENRIYCKFEVSFYTTSPDEGSGTGIGASGEYVQPWVSIALPKDIPFYSTATIEGLGTFSNMDTGSYIQWTYDDEGNLVCRVDVLVNTKEEAYSLGRYYTEGYIDINN